jgi:hypothetical protein
MCFSYLDIGYWNLFGVCLPAGRQGIWLLEFNFLPGKDSL